MTASRTAYERAYRWHVDAGDHARAAKVACELADIELSDLGGSAVAAGWLARARHHLRDEPDHPVRVLLEELSAYRALAYEKDPEAAGVFTRRAADLAERHGDAASLLDENWRHQQALDPAMCTPEMAALEARVRDAGGLGGKAAGSGAGGCMFFVVSDHARAAAAAHAAGARVLPVSWASEGVTAC